jgi:hypothetical protein
MLCAYLMKRRFPSEVPSAGLPHQVQCGQAGDAEVDVCGERRGGDGKGQMGHSAMTPGPRGRQPSGRQLLDIHIPNNGGTVRGLALDGVLPFIRCCQ